ncbi:hypothetical protein LLEC1_06300 [Akanthomyces lecanii]|uniref:Uncharacterized protein n=1 Tax=Cordyceps confragosa TaxID=2714763 RepID=A0A179I2B2_CORDF|nr:hypothetical protein LLEC1_06300 [Akanthomyces lecanii]
MSTPEFLPNEQPARRAIDRIEASLGSIERLLQRPINTPANIDSAEAEPDQGLNVQTDITVALLKQAVRSTTLYGVDSKMGAALGSLYDLLGKRHLSSPAGGGAAGRLPSPRQAGDAAAAGNARRAGETE